MNTSDVLRDGLLAFLPWTQGDETPCQLGNMQNATSDSITHVQQIPEAEMQDRMHGGKTS